LSARPAAISSRIWDCRGVTWVPFNGLMRMKPPTPGLATVGRTTDTAVDDLHYGKKGERAKSVKSMAT
jgi:hypothetical protein